MHLGRYCRDPDGCPTPDNPDVKLSAFKNPFRQGVSRSNSRKLEKINNHERFLCVSIAQSRQQLFSLINAAQLAPQTITKRNKAVAVLVSADYFKRTKEAAAKSDAIENGFFNQLVALWAAHPPQDDQGIPGADQPRIASWSRPNPFADTD